MEGIKKKDFEYRFKISVVMSVYNVALYVAEAIDSLLAQDIGFCENVQLILVNDGSTDDSGDICREYADRYPENILYIEKENGGLSSARNAGLRYVEGELVNFTDPDDTLSVNAFSEVYSFFKRNELFVDVVFIPLVFFEAKSGLHVKYRSFRSCNYVVSLDSEPWNFVLSSASGFYSFESVRDATFDEEMRGSEDSKFNCLLYKRNPRFGYVCERGVCYNYRQRYAADSIVNTADLSTLFSVERLLLELDDEPMPEWQKEMMIYELRARLNIIGKMSHDLDGSREALLDMYSRYIKRIDPYFILVHSKFCDSVEKKVAFLSLHDNLSVSDIVRKYSYFSHRRFDVRVLDASTKGEEFVIDTSFSPFGRDEIELLMVDGNGTLYSPDEEKDIHSPYDIIYGGSCVSGTKFSRFSFPLKTSKSLRFVFYDKNTGRFSSPKRVRIEERSKFAIQSDAVPVIESNKAISFNGRRFRIKKSEEGYALHLLKTTFRLCKENKRMLPARLLSFRSKRFILINDRPIKAGDNGEALYRHIVENRKDLAKNTFFVVSRRSPDYKRLKKIGRVVAHGGFLHKLLFLNSRYIFSSHNAPEFFLPFERKDLGFYADLLRYRFVFLQHGMTLNDVSSALGKYRTLAYRFVTCTKREWESVSSDAYMYDEDEVSFTGFPRFDLLEDAARGTILICPTWRTSLTGRILPSGVHETRDGFEESEYYRVYSSLLGSSELDVLLRSRNLRVKFLLHPGMAGYSKEFKTLERENVSILEMANANYSELFAESNLLITDYSSVFADFSYLRKPVIYFQFDEEEFFSKHYKRGYFDYRRDGFGEVLSSVEGVVEKIRFYAENDFLVEQEYLDRINEAFPVRDKNNSARVLSACGL